MEFQPIGCGMLVAVDANHRFGTDSILLAQFSIPPAGSAACDLGTGCGIIPLYWLREQKNLRVTGFELQAAACALAKEGAKQNSMEHCFAVEQGDLREVRTYFSSDSFDVVSCNPPYFTDAGKMTSRAPSSACARHETDCQFEDVAKAAAYLLHFGGQFCFCHRPQRLPNLLETVRRFGLEPKRLQLVQDRPDKAPFLVLVQCRKGGHPQLDVLPTLLLREEDGKLTKQAHDIYFGKEEATWQEN